MQEAQEAAAEAEAERGGGLHLVAEGGVVEPELAHGGAQILEIGGVHGEEAAEDDGLRRLEARQRLGCRAALVGDRVADAGVRHLLDRGGDDADLAGAEAVHGHELRREIADALHLVGGLGAHHADLLALPERAVDDAHEHHDAEVIVVPAVDEHRLQRRFVIALRRRQAGDDRLQHALDVEAGLGRDRHGVGGVEADHILDLLLDPLRLGGGQVDLVEDGHDLMVGVERLVDICQRLRLDALAGVDDEQRALAGGKAARDLVGEVDVARRVHQVERVGLAVLGLVLQPHRLRLDGDAALALDIHRVEDLLGHLAIAERPRRLDEAVRERRLAMVDMGDDREIPDRFDGMRRHARAIAGEGVEVEGGSPGHSVAGGRFLPRSREKVPAGG